MNTFRFESEAKQKFSLLKPGGLYWLTGRLGVGVTALALNYALRAIVERNLPVLYLAWQTRANVLFERLVFIHSGFPVRSQASGTEAEAMRKAFFQLLGCSLELRSPHHSSELDAFRTFIPFFDDALRRSQPALVILDDLFLSSFVSRAGFPSADKVLERIREMARHANFCCLVLTPLRCEAHRPSASTTRRSRRLRKIFDGLLLLTKIEARDNTVVNRELRCSSSGCEEFCIPIVHDVVTSRMEVARNERPPEHKIERKA